jgi:hypothetical protein
LLVEQAFVGSPYFLDRIQTMQTKEAIRGAMELSTMVYKGYLGDLEDNELLTRPGEGCNHLAWQVGHLIASEVSLLDSICPGKAASLPEGFAEAHSKDTAASDDPAKFLTKTQYLELMDQVHAATLKALEEIPDQELDSPSPENLRSFCPTIGHTFLLIATHPMMHAGQCVPVRRKLGKPVLF